MTKTDFLKAIADGNIDDTIINFAKKEVEKVEAKNGEKIAQNNLYIEKIVNYLEGVEKATAKDISKNTDITIQKVVALLKVIEGVNVEKTIQGTKVINIYNI